MVNSGNLIHFYEISISGLELIRWVFRLMRFPAHTIKLMFRKLDLNLILYNPDCGPSILNCLWSANKMAILACGVPKVGEPSSMEYSVISFSRDFWKGLSLLFYLVLVMMTNNSWWWFVDVGDWISTLVTTFDCWLLKLM